jgi:hypothetical protein
MPSYPYQPELEPEREAELDFELAEYESAYPGISCVTPGNPYVLHCFPPFKAELTADQHKHIDIIADVIRRSFSTPTPITKVQVTGHSARWDKTSQDTLDQRAIQRAGNAAGELIIRLHGMGLAKKVDVRPGVGFSDTVDWLGKPYSSTSGSQKAQNDRALNRRVEIKLIKSVIPGILPPRRDPTPEKRYRFIVARGDTTDEVRSLALQSARAAFKAQERMEYLESLPPQARRKEWNRGPEREWFGLYGASRRGHFGKVKRRIELIATVFRGRRNYTGRQEQKHQRVDLLTIESFNCKYPGDDICSRVDAAGMHPVLRWERGQTAEERLRIEARYHRKDRTYICCHERETLGFAFRAKTRVNRLPDLIDLGIADRPHKIALCPGWFTPPQVRRLRKLWARERNTTIVHEVAHLAGAMKLKVGLDPETGTKVLVNAEVYAPIELRTLARLAPFLARINAENYAKYVMEFAKD